tara:strand:+ start:823 stop:1395 length:573 start_codon:yes stop_codon:yes gene_type:complete
MTKPSYPWVALVGAAGAGKDTVADELTRRYGFTRVAFADPVRAALLALDPLIPQEGLGALRLSTAVDELGWENTKRLYPEVRYLLQRLGTDAIRSQVPHYWCDLAERTAVAADGPVVFTDTRFINELRMVESYGGTVVEVQRHNNPVLDSAAAAHASENEWRSWSPRFTLRNNGSKFDLATAVNTVMQNI